VDVMVALFACRAWNPEEYPPILRAAWHKSMAECERQGLRKPEIYPDSTIGTCRLCSVRVAVGPKARAQIATYEAAGKPFQIVCLLCGKILQYETGGGPVFSLGNPHGS
jgi:hypothetical protein